MSRRATLLVLFSLSGAASLVWQVVWVRELVAVFGSTVHAVSVVTSVFLLGLGGGAWLAGRWVDGAAPRQGLLGYAVAELAIAGWGLGLAWGLPMLAAGPAVDAYVLGAHGWWVPATGQVVSRTVGTALLLGPAPLAMGATLPLLVRDGLGTGRAGRWVAVLYGANTLGAALGALGADLLLVPRLGLLGAQGVAAWLNGVAAAGALALWWRRRPVDGPQVQPATVSLPPALVAVALAGAAAMGLELAWFRFLGSALGPYRATFSVLLFVMLLAMQAGALLAGRVRWPRRVFAWTQATVALAALFGLLTYEAEWLVRLQLGLADDFATGSQAWRSVAQLGVNLRVVAWVVGPAALAMGAAFPLANLLAQTGEQVGARVGGLYLALTLGNVFGAVVTGFVMLPGLGVQTTVLGLCVLAVLAPLPLGVRHTWPAVVVGLLGIGLAAQVAPDRLVQSALPANRVQAEGVLALREGKEQTLVVTGERAGPARLWTGGHPMTSTTVHAQRYMRLMAHLPLLTQAAPERALVICFGVGNTSHAASLHPLRELEVVDRSADVLALAPWFSHANHDVLSDARVRTFVNDGRHHLRTREEGYYDVITLEPPPIGTAGVASLYSQEFYALARSRLKAGGALTQWLPAYQLPEAAVASLVRAFVEVFDEATLHVGSGRELVLMGRKGEHRVSATALQTRLDERPAVAADLARLDFTSADELLTTYLAGGATLRAATAQAAPLRDDWPITEHVQLSHIMETRLPPALFAPTQDSWCSDCSHLAPRRAVLAQVVADEDFLRFANLTGGSVSSTLKLPPEAGEVVRESPFLTALLRR